MDVKCRVFHRPCDVFNVTNEHMFKFQCYKMKYILKPNTMSQN